MYVFWTLWGIDALAALILVSFFFVGLSDGSVSEDNMVIWLLLLVGAAALLGGGYWLFTHQQAVAAKLVLALLAIPTLLYGLFILFALIINPRWN